jgi:translation initiation factor IF-2
VLAVADAELGAAGEPEREASGRSSSRVSTSAAGPVATMLVQRGTLKVGDAIVAGDAWGKVRALHNYKGDKLNDARPGDPVEILGFDKPPQAGELARVVENEREARDLAQKRSERVRREQFATRPTSGITLEGLFEHLQAGEIQDLNIVVKGDVQGSVEAIVSELAKIKHAEVRVNVIHSGVGGITENDINLAAASSGMVVGFNVRPNAETRRSPSARASRFAPTTSSTSSPRTSSRRSSGCSQSVTTEETIGEAEVRETFRASASARSPAAWSRTASSAAARTCRWSADSTVVYATTIDSLKRFQDDAREVQEGLRVRPPPRELRRRQGRRRARGLRDARGRAHLARRAGRVGGTGFSLSLLSARSATPRKAGSV